MSKPKSYVGETYSNPFDHGGKTYRWDHKKKEYVLSRGNSPIASIKRSWNQKIVPAAQAYAERQTRLTQEALNQKTPNINEYFNSLLQERWDNAVTEDEKSSVKDLLAAFNLEEQKGIITEETGADTTSVIPETFTDYRRRTAGEIAEAEVIESDADKQNNELNTNVIKTEEDKIDKEANKQPTTLSAGYQRPSPAERQKRRMEEILVRGRPGEKFKLDRERGRGTDINDLFTKNREK